MSEPVDVGHRPESAGAAATRSAEGEITVDATPERVWHALTDARELERWFPLDARVEPGEGGSIYMSWRNEFAGEMKILVWDPPHHLRTEWSFGEGGQHAQVTDYVVEARGGKTIVRVVTSGFPLDASWDGWVEGTKRGWAYELHSLKHYLERHDGEDRSVIYIRRRVPLAREEIWSRLRGGALGRWLSAGDPFDDRSESQYAAIASDPQDAMFRVSIEPPGPGADQPEVVLFLSAWGEQRDRAIDLEREWQRQLEDVFPDGTTP
ncbi:MAG TPA: SRPBCC domain-containing protein [Longimicrobiales bacterium]